MQERMVSWVLSVVEKSESSFVDLRVRESGARVMRFGLERRARVQGMRRKGAVVSEGAILEGGVGGFLRVRGSWVSSLLCSERSVVKDILIRFVESEHG